MWNIIIDADVWEQTGFDFIQKIGRIIVWIQYKNEKKNQNDKRECRHYTNAHTNENENDDKADENNDSDGVIRIASHSMAQTVVFFDVQR